MKSFVIIRNNILICELVIFKNGKCIVSWVLNPLSSIIIYDKIEDVENIMITNCKEKTEFIDYEKYFNQKS